MPTQQTLEDRRELQSDPAQVQNVFPEEETFVVPASRKPCDKRNRLGGPEIHSLKENTKVVQSGSNVRCLFQKWCKKTGFPYVKNEVLNSTNCYIKINSKWTKYLNIRAKSSESLKKTKNRISVTLIGQ